MPIKLAISGRPDETADGHEITLGSGSECHVAFRDSIDIWPVHAVIYQVDGRWKAEAKDASSIFLESLEPTRELWLKPGTAFRLTKDSPLITFLPIEHDDFLPLIAAPAADASLDLPLLPLELDQPLPELKPATTPAQKPPSSATIKAPSAATTKAPSSPSIDAIKVPLSDEIPLAIASESGEIPTTKPAAPKAKAPTSTSIPTTKPTSSATIKATNPPLSGTVRTTKSPSSGTIKATKPPSSDAVSTTKPPSSATINALGQKGPAKTTRPKSALPDEDGVIAGAPVLKRMSFSQEAEYFDESFDESLDELPRKKRSRDKEEMQWIMTVIARCCAVGAVLLFVWFSYNQISKSLSTPTFSTPPIAENSASADQNLAQSYIAPSPSQSRPKTNTNATSTPSTKPGEGDTSTTSEESDSDDDPMQATADNDPANEAPAIEASALIKSIQNSLYAVIAEDRQNDRRIQLGTAWAATDRHLVSTATVAIAVEEFQNQGLSVVAVQPTSRLTISINGARAHKGYHSHQQSVDEAISMQHETILAKERAIQVKLDLGVLDIDKNDRLESPLPFNPKPLKGMKDREFDMVGFPFQEDQVSTNSFDVGNLKERRSKRLKDGRAVQNREFDLVIQYPVDSVGGNWAGSPVLGRDHKVIGIYAQLPELKTSFSKKVTTERAIVWIGRLQDVAPEILKSVAPKPKTKDHID